jgi:1,4-alpha-glucan branching enzyme
VPETVAAALLAIILFTGCSSLFSARERSTAETDNRGLIEVWLPNAVSVQVIGDWNHWGGLEQPGGIVDPTVDRLTRSEDGEGLWTIRLDLEPGRYRYVLLVDGWIWMRDPCNPEISFYSEQEVSLMVLER